MAVRQQQTFFALLVFFFPLGDSLLFPFTQMDVHDSTAEEQWYTNPRQEKTVAEMSRAQLPRVLKDFFIV